MLPQIPVNFLELAKRPKSFYWMVAFRSKIHENPELGFEEFEIRILKLSLTRWASLTNTQRAFFLKK